MLAYDAAVDAAMLLMLRELLRRYCRFRAAVFMLPMPLFSASATRCYCHYYAVAAPCR